MRKRVRGTGAMIRKARKKSSGRAMANTITTARNTRSAVKKIRKEEALWARRRLGLGLAGGILLVGGFLAR